MQDHMTPHDQRGNLPYKRAWPRAGKGLAGNVPAPVRALAEFLVAPARLVHQTIGLDVLGKTLGGLLVLVIVMLGSSSTTVSSSPSPAAPTLAAGISSSPPADPDELTFLILGVDSMQDRGRSDTVLVVRLLLKQHKVHILSIPRDSYAVIEKPGGVVEDKLNHSYRFGGAELTKKTVEQNLGIKIDYYGVVDYDLFRKAIDLIGCVELDVEKRYYYVDNAGGLKVDLFPGRQQLCGDKALQYVRFRHDAMGDEGRIVRQQKFLGAALAKLKDPKVVTFVGFKLPSLLEYVTTDVPSQVAMGLLWKVKDISAHDLSMASVPGEGKLMDTPIHRQRLWFYLMDKERLEKLKTEWFFNPDATQSTAAAIVRGHGPAAPSAPMNAPEETAPSGAPALAPSAPGASSAPGLTPDAPADPAPVLRSPFQPPRTNGAKKSVAKASPSAKPAPAPKASAKAAPKPSPKAPSAAPSAAPASTEAPAAPPTSTPPAPAPAPAHRAQPSAAPSAAAGQPAGAPPAPFGGEDDPMGRDAVDKALEHGPSAPADPAVDQPVQPGGGGAAPKPAQHPAQVPVEPEDGQPEEAQTALPPQDGTAQPMDPVAPPADAPLPMQPKGGRGLSQGTPAARPMAAPHGIPGNGRYVPSQDGALDPDGQPLTDTQPTAAQPAQPDGEDGSSSADPFGAVIRQAGQQRQPPR